MVTARSKRRLGLVGTLFFLLIASAPSVFAEEEVDNIFDLERITCEDILALPGEDAGYAFVLLLGYSEGMSNRAHQSASVIERKIKGAFETCSENPDLPALQSFSDEE